MRNSEKFKTAKERARAFSKWCNLTNGKDCLKIESCNLCAFKWLDLEAKEKGEKARGEGGFGSTGDEVMDAIDYCLRLAVGFGFGTVCYLIGYIIGRNSK